jgi:hypothetical protein
LVQERPERENAGSTTILHEERRMNMKSKFMSVLVVCLVTTLFLNLLQQGQIDNESAVGSVLGTAFFTAWAATGEEQSVEESSFLKQEAGIAAYVKVDQAINIPQLRASFKVVEQLSDTYLTGQIAIPNLNENWHPHLFVTHDGWIVAYHSRYEPASIMLTTWITRADTTLTGTTLELAIREILRNAGISPSGIMEKVKYHHFQYPGADRIMLIREDEQHGNADIFYLTIPAGLGILDASWIAYDNVGGWSGMSIDSDTICAQYGELMFGDFLPHLRTGTRHTITVYRGNYGVVLLYQAP